MDYLVKVIVYNLLPADYRKNQLAKIEGIISSTIFLAAKDAGVEGGIFFSFPRDPSMKTSAAPVGIEVRPYFKSKKNMALAIKESLLPLLEETRNVFVEVHGFGGCMEK